MVTAEDFETPSEGAIDDLYYISFSAGLQYRFLARRGCRARLDTSLTTLPCSAFDPATGSSSTAAP